MDPVSSKPVKPAERDSEASKTHQKRGGEHKISILARSASRLDDQELDRLFVMALRGDHDKVVAQLDKMGITDADITTPGWSETSSWMFQRRTK